MHPERRTLTPSENHAGLVICDWSFFLPLAPVPGLVCALLAGCVTALCYPR